MYAVNPNVNGGCKLLLLKMSVGGIVLQGLLLDALYTSGTLNIKANDEYSGQEREQRALCKCTYACRTSLSLMCVSPHPSFGMCHRHGHSNRVQLVFSARPVGLWIRSRPSRDCSPEESVPHPPGGPPGSGMGRVETTRFFADGCIP